MTCAQVHFRDQVAVLSCVSFNWFKFQCFIIKIFCTVRSSSPPTSAEPSVAPHPKSYMDVSS